MHINNPHRNLTEKAKTWTELKYDIEFIAVQAFAYEEKFEHFVLNFIWSTNLTRIKRIIFYYLEEFTEVPKIQLADYNRVQIQMFEELCNRLPQSVKFKNRSTVQVKKHRETANWPIIIDNSRER